VTATADLLTEHPFLTGLESMWLERLGEHAHPVYRNSQHRLFAVGGSARHFWLLQSGRVALDIHAPGRGDVVVETIGPGAVLGWSWLFPPYRWHFGAVVVEPVRAIEFEAAAVRRLMAADPGLSAALTGRFMQVVVERLQATRVRLLDLYGYPEGAKP
jgi:CRP/FNR family cyclic AMP-dependent transcriptional regulator